MEARDSAVDFDTENAALGAVCTCTCTCSAIAMALPIPVFAPRLLLLDSDMGRIHLLDHSCFTLALDSGFGINSCVLFCREKNQDGLDLGSGSDSGSSRRTRKWKSGKYNLMMSTCTAASANPVQNCGRSLNVGNGENTDANIDGRPGKTGFGNGDGSKTCAGDTEVNENGHPRNMYMYESVFGNGDGSKTCAGYTDVNVDGQPGNTAFANGRIDNGAKTCAGDTDANGNGQTRFTYESGVAFEHIGGCCKGNKDSALNGQPGNVHGTVFGNGLIGDGGNTGNRDGNGDDPPGNMCETGCGNEKDDPVFLYETGCGNRRIVDGGNENEHGNGNYSSGSMCDAVFGIGRDCGEGIRNRNRNGQPESGFRNGRIGDENGDGNRNGQSGYDAGLRNRRVPSVCHGRRCCHRSGRIASHIRNQPYPPNTMLNHNGHTCNCSLDTCCNCSELIFNCNPDSNCHSDMDAKNCMSKRTGETFMPAGGDCDGPNCSCCQLQSQSIPAFCGSMVTHTESGQIRTSPECLMETIPRGHVTGNDKPDVDSRLPEVKTRYNRKTGSSLLEPETRAAWRRRSLPEVTRRCLFVTMLGLTTLFPVSTVAAVTPPASEYLLPSFSFLVHFFKVSMLSSAKFIKLRF